MSHTGAFLSVSPSHFPTATLPSPTQQAWEKLGKVPGIPGQGGTATSCIS